MLKRFQKTNTLLQKREWRFFSRFRYLNYVLFVFFLIGLFFTLNLFYTIIFRTISDATAAFDLGNTLRVEAIMFSKLEKTEELWADKYETPLPEQMKDPFAGKVVFPAQLLPKQLPQQPSPEPSEVTTSTPTIGNTTTAPTIAETTSPTSSVDITPIEFPDSTTDPATIVSPSI